MARFFQVDELEARKRALVTESEVYRQALKLEAQNLQLYGAAARRKLLVFGAVRPLLLTGLPFLLGWWRQRRAPAAKPGLLKTALIGWRLYRQFGPVVHAFIQQFRSQKHPASRASSKSIRSYHRL
jgi:hypothetical protein